MQFHFISNKFYLFCVHNLINNKCSNQIVTVRFLAIASFSLAHLKSAHFHLRIMLHSLLSFVSLSALASNTVITISYCSCKSCCQPLYSRAPSSFSIKTAIKSFKADAKKMFDATHLLQAFSIPFQRPPTGRAPRLAPVLGTLRRQSPSSPVSWKVPAFRWGIAYYLEPYKLN